MVVMPGMDMAPPLMISGIAARTGRRSGVTAGPTPERVPGRLRLRPLLNVACQPEATGRTWLAGLASGRTGGPVPE